MLSDNSVENIGITSRVNSKNIEKLYEVRAQIKALQETETAIKDAVIESMGGEDTIESRRFILKRIISERKGSIDTKKLIADGINPDDYRGKDITAVSLKVDIKAEFKAALVKPASRSSSGSIARAA